MPDPQDQTLEDYTKDRLEQGVNAEEAAREWVHARGRATAQLADQRRKDAGLPAAERPRARATIGRARLDPESDPGYQSLLEASAREAGLNPDGTPAAGSPTPPAAPTKPATPDGGAYAPPAASSAAPGQPAGIGEGIAAGVENLNRLAQQAPTGGGPATTTTKEYSTLQPRTPEDAQRYAEDQAKYKADEQARLGQIAAHGDAVAKSIIGQATAAQAASDFWTQKANEQQQRQLALQDEYDRRLKAKDEASKAFDEFAREAPLGSVLNPTGAQKVMGAFALMAGGFVQGFRGLNVNPAQQIIDGAIKDELAYRRERLGALESQQTQSDKTFAQMVDSLGSVQAAEHAYKGLMYNALADKQESMAKLTSSEEERQGMLSMAAQLRLQSDQEALAGDQRAMVDVKTKQTIHAGGAGTDPLKRAMQLNDAVKGFLSNAAEYQKLTGATGVSQERTMKMYDRMEKAGIVSFDSSTAVVREAIKRAGGVSTALGRALAGVDSGDSNALETMLSKLDRQEDRDVAKALLGLVTDSAHALFKSRIRPDEFAREATRLGLNRWSSAQDVMNGLDRLERQVDIHRKDIGGYDLPAYAALRAAQAKAREDTESGWRSTAPEHGKGP